MGQCLTKSESFQHTLGNDSCTGLAKIPSRLEPKVMENFLLQFPTVSEEIFKQLDNESLIKCKKVGRPWKNFLDQNKSNGKLNFCLKISPRGGNNRDVS